MAAPMPSYGADEQDRPRVDAKALWPGGVATAVVAGLIALVGVLLSRWLAKIPLLAPRADGAYGNVHTTGFVLAAAFAALVATALAHLLLLSTPRPMVFFKWIVGLVTVVAVLFPFSTSAGLEAKAATAVVELVIGIAIGSLISGVGTRSLRARPAARYPRERSGPDASYRVAPPAQRQYRVLPAEPEDGYSGGYGQGGPPASRSQPGGYEQPGSYDRPGSYSPGPDNPPTRPYDRYPPEEPGYPQGR